MLINAWGPINAWSLSGVNFFKTKIIGADMSYKQGVAVPNFSFTMLDKNLDPVTAGTTTGIIVKNGVASTTLANASYIGNDFWNISFTAAEMDGVDQVTFKPVNSSAVPQAIELKTYNELDSNLMQINGVTLPVDNLQSQYDGTGLSGESYPATQGQVSNIAVTGSAVNTVADGYVLTTGTQTANTFSDTHTPDDIRHTHTDTGGALDLYYEFDLTPAGVPTGLKILGKVTGSNDQVTVYAYNWITATWNQVGVMIGSNSAANETDSFDLLTAHVGTGADVGKCRIRFFEPSGLTAATLYVDQLLVAQTYAAGGIANGSTVTLTESITNSNLIGNGWRLNLGGQDISGAYIKGAVAVSGTATCANNNGFIFEDCNFLAATIPARGFIARAAISEQDTLTFVSTTGAVADNVSLTECFSGVAGTDVPAIDVSGVTKTTSVNCRGWTGGLKVTLNEFVTMSIDVVAGGNIKIYGTGGLVRIAGTCVAQDFSGGAVTIVDVSVLNQDSISTAVWEATTAPTVAEFEARTLPNADYFDPATDIVANVTTVQTTVSNSDMRGTDNALLASAYIAPDNATIASIDAKIDNVPTVAEFNARTLPSASYFDPLTDQVIIGTNNDKTGYSIAGTKTTLDALNDFNATAETVTINSTSVDSIFAGGDIDGYTLEQSQRLILASQAGKFSGGGTSNIVIRDAADTKARITATVDQDGNRISTTLDAS